MITFQPARSTFWLAGLFRSMCRSVGTQWEKVTFSRWIRPSKPSGV